MDVGDASPVTDSRTTVSGASLRDWARASVSMDASPAPPSAALLAAAPDADEEEDAGCTRSACLSSVPCARCCLSSGVGERGKAGSRKGGRLSTVLPSLLLAARHPAAALRLLRGAAAAVLPLRHASAVLDRANSGRSGGVPTRVVNVAAPNFGFASNRVSNTRYTPLTFLPLNLAEQFKAPLNLYFLMIAFLQLWKAITPVNPITTWAPLLLVASISAVRAALDDLRRARVDAAANGRPYTVYRWVTATEEAGKPHSKSGSASAASSAAVPHRLREVPDCPSESIRVGDLVRVNDDEEVPCDLVLLRTSGVVADGVVYLETANLDGETDSKPRQALAATQSLAAAWVEEAQEGRTSDGRVSVQVACDAPNPDLYTFNSVLRIHSAAGGEHDAGGSVTAPPSSTLPLTGTQLLQHGAVLRKSGWALGVAVYTGAETKMSLNRSAAPVKVGVADRFINKLTVAVFLLQVVVVAVFGTWGHHWAGNGNTAVWYLDWHADLRAAWHLAQHGHAAGAPLGGAALPSAVDGTTASTEGVNMSPEDAAALLQDMQALDVLPDDHIAHPEEGNGVPGGGSVGGDVSGGGRRLAAQPEAGEQQQQQQQQQQEGELPSSQSQARRGSHHLPRHTHPWYTALILPLRFLLLSSMLVPISLRITLDLVKVIYAALIAKDDELASGSATGLSEGGRPLVNATSSLEDLGLIEVVLTDKTGTLTENVMSLVRVGVGATVYGAGSAGAEGADPNASSTAGAQHAGTAAASPSKPAAAASAPLAGDAALAERLACFRGATGGVGTRSPPPPTRELDLFLALAVCNSVQPEHIDTIPLAAADLQALYDRQLQRRRGSVLAAGGGASWGSSRVASARSGGASARSGGDGPAPLLAMAPSELSSALRSQYQPSLNPLASPVPARGRAPHRHLIPPSPALVLPVPADSPPAEEAEEDAAMDAGLSFGAVAAGLAAAAASPPSSATSSGGAAAASPAAHAASAPRRYLQFASSSPDEEALVYGAATVGVTLLDRRPAQPDVEPSEAGLKQWLTVALPPPVAAAVGGGAPRAAAGAPASSASPAAAAALPSSTSKRVAVSDAAPRVELGVVKVLEFSSDRKRMSVLVRLAGGSPAALAFRGLTATAAEPVSPDADALLLVTKGADDTVLPCLAPCYGRRGSTPGTPQGLAELAALQAQLRGFAREGLRTLVVAARVVPKREYAEWEKSWSAAQAEVGAGREAAVAAAAAALERGLHLVGATAIEDKLQAGVPATIAALRRAGIQWWMLTGDKTETAMQIARSTGLASAAGEAEGFIVVDAPDGSEAGVSSALGAAWAALQAHSRKASGGAAVVVVEAPAAGAAAAEAADAGTDDEVPELASLLGGGGSSHSSRRRGGATTTGSSLDAAGQEGGAAMCGPSASAVAALAAAGEATAQAEAGGAPAAPPASGAAPLPSASRPQSAVASASSSSSAPPCLVLTGAALPHILASPARCAVLLRLAAGCEAVVCSRCSPAQKAALARLVGSSGRVTLAIGDGGNDVAMLQAASVGIGLAGREGQQAARAADIALGRFEALARLLLVHGRLAYYRTALTTQYTFYKSMCICIFQLLFNTSCAFSGGSFFDSFGLTTYNMVFTFIPGLLLCLDQDRPLPALLKHPETYAEGRGGKSRRGGGSASAAPGTWLTWRTYAGWSARALYQCCVVYAVVMGGTGTRSLLGGGSSGLDAPTASYVVFTTLLLVQLITLVLTPRRPTSWNFSGASACLACYALVFAVVSRGPYRRLPLSVAGMTSVVFTDPTLLAAAGLAVVAALVPWMAWETAARAKGAPKHGAQRQRQQQQHHHHH